MNLSRTMQSEVAELLRDWNGQDTLRDHPAFLRLIVWCDEHGKPFDEGGGDGEGFSALNLAHLGEYFCDETLRDYEGLNEAEPITRDERIAYMRNRLASWFEDDLDADVHPICLVLRVRGGNRSAFLGCRIRGYSFSGVECTWDGMFNSEDAYRLWLRERGYLTRIQEFDARDPEEKLRRAQDQD